MTPAQTTAESAIADTQRWLERAVIACNLCPFAKAPHVKGLIHYAVYLGDDHLALLHKLEQELLDLQKLAPEERETSLLIAPHAMTDFLQFNDWLGQAEALLTDLSLQGELQIASFHPHFQFAGAQVDDISNATNWSPYPTLHLLREASIERALQAMPQSETIYQNNIHTLEKLGSAGWQALDVGPGSAQRGCHGG